MAIVNFGSLNIDLVYRVPGIVKPGETISSSAFQTFAGGKGANQSVAIARAGGRVRHCGCIGQDGLWLRDKLADAGVDVGGIVIHDSKPTGHAVIQVDDNGQNAIVIFAGANRAISDAQIDEAVDSLGPEDFVLLQNETNGVARIIRAAAAAGASVWFNPAPFGVEVQAYPLDQVTCLILNETEAEALAGISADFDSIEHALDVRAASGQTIVLTRGAKGATCWYQGRRIDVPAPVVTARDTTAAGDTFIGYLLAGVSQGVSMHTAMRQAVVAASLCVTRPGAMDAIPSFDEVATHL